LIGKERATVKEGGFGRISEAAHPEEKKASIRKKRRKRGASKRGGRAVGRETGLRPSAETPSFLRGKKGGKTMTR